MKWKTWKKFGVIAMAVIMGAAFLAGCGSDSNKAHRIASPLSLISPLYRDQNGSALLVIAKKRALVS